MEPGSGARRVTDEEGGTESRSATAEPPLPGDAAGLPSEPESSTVDSALEERRRRWHAERARREQVEREQRPPRASSDS